MKRHEMKFELEVKMEFWKKWLLVRMSTVLLFDVTEVQLEELGIDDLVKINEESSCDESACAIVENGRKVIANVVATQIPIHQKYGGVIDK